MRGQRGGRGLVAREPVHRRALPVVEEAIGGAAVEVVRVGEERARRRVGRRVNRGEAVRHQVGKHLVQLRREGGHGGRERVGAHAHLHSLGGRKTIRVRAVV